MTTESELLHMVEAEVRRIVVEGGGPPVFAYFYCNRC